jgi:hypothetical protein
MKPGALTEPDADPERLALDRAVAEAVRRRLAAGPRPTNDGDAIALRDLMTGVSPSQASVLRAVLGRIDAAAGAPLVVWGGAAQTLAADRFGLGARAAVEPEQALAAVRDGARALMDLTPGRAWWGRLLAEPTLRIVAALPDNRHGAPRALLVQGRPPGPTGDDRTFWATDSTAPDGRILEILGGAGLVASPLIAAGGLKLFMLAGYVQAEDGRLAAAPGSLSGVIGAAPVF